MNSSSSPLNKHELTQIAHKDLTIRARGGIVIYIAVWLVTSFATDLHITNPTFFYLNTAFIVIFMLLRIIHYVMVMHKPENNTDFMYYSLVSMILLSAFHWGVLSAWGIIMFTDAFLEKLYMILLGAFAMGGTVMLSISRPLAILYPVFLFVPTLLFGVDKISVNNEYMTLAILAIVSFIYVSHASKASNRDYWDAIEKRFKAETRIGELETINSQDELTGLFNRGYFNRRFVEEWNRCRRSNSFLSLFILDLDYFKQVNDNHGHLAGDKCLIEVGKFLQEVSMRPGDMVARYGGEEFVLLLPETDSDGAERIAKKLIEKIREVRITWEEETISITCSIGVASFIPDDKHIPMQLFNQADAMLYKAKQAGRDQYHIGKDNAALALVNDLT